MFFFLFVSVKTESDSSAGESPFVGSEALATFTNSRYPCLTPWGLPLQDSCMHLLPLTPHRSRSLNRSLNWSLVIWIKTYLSSAYRSTNLTTLVLLPACPKSFHPSHWMLWELSEATGSHRVGACCLLTKTSACLIDQLVGARLW